MTRKRLLRLLFVAVLMWDILRRWFSDARPIDWVLVVLETLIAVVILFEAFIALHRYFTKLRTSKRLLILMLKGQQLQATVPNSGVDAPPWNGSVELWATATYDFLKSRSDHAALAFAQNRGGQLITYRHVPQNAQTFYVMLLERLDNLRSIIEKPDVYF